MEYKKLTVKETLKLLAASGLILSSLALPNLALSYSKLAKEWRKYKKGDIGRIIKRLRKQELISVKDDGNTIEIELSEDGRRKLLSYNFEEISLPKRRDGKLRVVIFDIPNEKKVARDMFRAKLILLGFKRIQKSIFLSPYPCKKEVEFITYFLGIEKYVSLMQVGKVELGPTFEFISSTK